MDIFNDKKVEVFIMLAFILVDIAQILIEIYEFISIKICDIRIT